MRAAATANITFGLVSIPVKLYVAASDESVEFNMLNEATGNRVKQKLVDVITGDEVDRDKTIRGYEYAKGQYVKFTNDELKALEPASSKTIDVQEFVPADSIDGVSVERWYYLGPDKGGDKGYMLLAETMRTQGVIAVAQWATRGKEHLVTLAPHKQGLALRVMYYADELRSFDEVMDGVAKFPVSEAERKLALQLVEQLSTPAFEPGKYSDAYASRVREAAKQKAEGGEITVPPAQVGATIVDMVEALKKSLLEKKPLVKAPAEPLPDKKAKRGGKKGA